MSKSLQKQLQQTPPPNDRGTAAVNNIGPGQNPASERRAAANQPWHPPQWPTVRGAGSTWV